MGVLTPLAEMIGFAVMAIAGGVFLIVVGLNLFDLLTERMAILYYRLWLRKEGAALRARAKQMALLSKDPSK